MSSESTSLAPSGKTSVINATAQGNTRSTNNVNNGSGSAGSSNNSNNCREKSIRHTTSYTYVAIRDRIPARLVLYFLSCSGFLVSFMMRNDMNFALVAMINGRNDSALYIQNTYDHCINDFNKKYGGANNFTMSNDVDVDENGITSAALALTTINQTTIDATDINDVLRNRTQIANDIKCKNEYLKSMSKIETMVVYNWSQTVKSIIITSFYVWYVLSQVVGGIATQYFGTKQVFGWSQFATAAASLCIPFCADWHYSVVILLRSIQGFASGLTWPAMYAIVGHWIPLVERSRFMSSFQGFSIGIGLTYPLCGFIIVNFGWRYVFYTTGTLGMCWCICWYLLAYNTPQEHPRITSHELAYIELHVSTDATELTYNKRVPWCSIFCSTAAWAIAITTFGRIWIHYVFIVGGPTFMKHILKLDYQENGFLSGMPFICSYFSSVIFCYIADKLTQARLLHLTNVRKLFTALSQVVPGLLMLRMCYIELNVTHILIIWFIAVTFITASYAGAMANIVDIAPNFAGPVLAFCQTIHMSASFLSPFVAGQIVVDETQIDQWHTVFIVSTIVTIVTYLVYQIFCTSDIQKWNYTTVENQIVTTPFMAKNGLNDSNNDGPIDGASECQMPLNECAVADSISDSNNDVVEKLHHVHGAVVDNCKSDVNNGTTTNLVDNDHNNMLKQKQ